jgi:predicted amidohydrolase
VKAARSLKPLVGEGVLMSEGETWRRQRKSLAPVFTPAATGGLLPHFIAAGAGLTEELASRGRANLAQAFHRATLDAVLRALFSRRADKEGDVLAHPFTRHPGGFVNREGEVHPVIQAAIDRGLKIDVGHGSHFSYRLAKKAIAAGIVPNPLGADIHGYNTDVPAPSGTPDEHEDDENHPFKGQAKFSLVQAMSSMMALGLTLEQVVPMVTSHPARMLGMTDTLGALAVGRTADVTVLTDDRGHFLLRDNVLARMLPGVPAPGPRT